MLGVDANGDLLLLHGRVFKPCVWACGPGVVQFPRAGHAMVHTAKNTVLGSDGQTKENNKSTLHSTEVDHEVERLTADGVFGGASLERGQQGEVSANTMPSPCLDKHSKDVGSAFGV
jgi:hypothetical protein